MNVTNLNRNRSRLHIRNFLEKNLSRALRRIKYYKKYLEGVTLDEVNQFGRTVPGEADPKPLFLTGPENSDFKCPKRRVIGQLSESAGKAELTAYEEKAVAAIDHGNCARCWYDNCGKGGYRTGRHRAFAE